MSKLYSIDNRLNKIKKEYLSKNPKKVLMFVEEDNLPVRKVKLQYNKKEEIVYCKNEKEWEELINIFIDYEKMIFINVKKPQPGDVVIGNLN